MEKALSKEKKYLPFIVGLALVCAAYLTLCALINLDLFEHSPYDSYTLQAMTWRSGRIDLEGEYPWLEIAKYEGRRYISFPPFPTILMLPLTFFFGEDTPSRLVSFAMVIISYAGGYFIARKHGACRPFAALCALFLVMGCNMAEFALYGGVWNIAQSMGFALTILAFGFAASDKRICRYFSLIAIACAVGCRPFQAFYVPVLLFIIGQHVLSETADKKAFIVEMLRLILVPFLIAVAYGVYNYIRFDNPFEFGHNYLPEFAEQSEHGQFSTAYMLQNLRNILRLPWFEDGLLVFPTAFGFAFYITNPLFILFAITAILTFIRRRQSAIDILFILTLLTHFLALLMHKSMGGVQFGTRYLCDLVPAMFFYWTLRRGSSKPEGALACFLIIFGIAMNLYGAWCFHVVLGV